MRRLLGADVSVPLESHYTRLHHQIYVDEYKGQIYHAIGAADPQLRAIITNNPQSRFHACDHDTRCQECMKGKGEIVTIHWAEVMIATFSVRHEKVVQACKRAKEGKGEWPRYLVSPAGRVSQGFPKAYVFPVAISRGSTFSSSGTSGPRSALPSLDHQSQYSSRTDSWNRLLRHDWDVPRSPRSGWR